MNRSFWLFTRLYCWECNSYLSYFFFFITHSWVIVHAISCLLSENKLHCTNHFCPSGIFEMCKIIRETSRYLRYEQDPSQNKEEILSSSTIKSFWIFIWLWSNQRFPPRLIWKWPFARGISAARPGQTEPISHLQPWDRKQTHLKLLTNLNVKVGERFCRCWRQLPGCWVHRGKARDKSDLKTYIRASRRAVERLHLRRKKYIV